MGFFGFGSKKKKGYVYAVESTRRDGSKKIYVGATTRPIKKRIGEHLSGRGGRFTGSATSNRLIGASYSNNCWKAEKTLKRKSPAKKRAFAGYSASKYKKRTSSW
jgi:predicted GIY-YIG superfamily endonuclease